MSSPNDPFEENRVICKKQAKGYEERVEDSQYQGSDSQVRPNCLTLFVRFQATMLLSMKNTGTKSEKRRNAVQR